MNSCEDWLSDGAGLHYAGAGASSSRAVFDRLWRIGGIRDSGGLSSAVGQPLNDYFYGQADLFAIAAAYAFHIAQAQAFLDGNKRTAITSRIKLSRAKRCSDEDHDDRSLRRDDRDFGAPPNESRSRANFSRPLWLSRGRADRNRSPRALFCGACLHGNARPETARCDRRRWIRRT